MGLEILHHSFVRGLYRPSAERVAGFIQTLASDGRILPPRSKSAARIRGASFRSASRWVGNHFVKPQPAPFTPSAEWLRAHKPYVALSWLVGDVFERGARYPL